MRKMTRRSYAAAATGAAFALILAGCSDGDDDTTPRPVGPGELTRVVLDRIGDHS